MRLVSAAGRRRPNASIASVIVTCMIALSAGSLAAPASQGIDAQSAVLESAIEVPSGAARLDRLQREMNGLVEQYGAAESTSIVQWLVAGTHR